MEGQPRGSRDGACGHSARKPNEKDRQLATSPCWVWPVTDNLSPQTSPLTSTRAPKGMVLGHSRAQGCGLGPQQHPRQRRAEPRTCSPRLTWSVQNGREAPRASGPNRKHLATLSHPRAAEQRGPEWAGTRDAESGGRVPVPSWTRGPGGTHCTPLLWGSGGPTPG